MYLLHFSKFYCHFIVMTDNGIIIQAVDLMKENIFFITYIFSDIYQYKDVYKTYS